MEKVLFDRFVVLEKIAKGGNAEIYMLYDMKQKVFKALKIDENINSILDEYDCIKLNTYDYSYSFITLKKHKEEFYGIIMDMFGYSLYDFLTVYCLEEEEFEIIINIFETEIKKLHNKGYLHLDIKPENIMIQNIEHYKYINKKSYVRTLHKKCDYKCTQQVGLKIFKTFKKNPIKKVKKIDTDLNINDIKMCLIDFGFVEEISEKKSNIKRDKCYTTCYYISPVFIFQKCQNKDCDFWAFGCSLFELIFDKPLFDLNSENCYDEDIQELQEKMVYMNIDPENFIDERIQSCRCGNYLHNPDIAENIISLIKKKMLSIMTPILEQYIL